MKDFFNRLYKGLKQVKRDLPAELRDLRKRFIAHTKRPANWVITAITALAAGLVTAPKVVIVGWPILSALLTYVCWILVAWLINDIVDTICYLWGSYVRGYGSEA